MIVILKLTNGTEVVGEIEHENSYEVVISNPLQINYRYFNGPLPSVSFVRYIMFAETSSVTFDRQHVMHQIVARESFANFYRSSIEGFSNNVVKMIDDELQGESVTKDQLEQLLESMPVEGMTIN